MMQRTRKLRPPKHLEKMLFINHKEDTLLQDRLNDLKLKCKLKVLELDFERRKVTSELRASRKKNIQLTATSGGAIAPSLNGRDLRRQNEDERIITPSIKASQRRQSASNTTRPKMNVVSAPRRRPSFENNSGHRRISTAVQFRRQPSILEVDEIDEEERVVNDSEEGEIQRRIDVSRMDRACSTPQDTVGTYVLREFRRMSQVVPSILRQLSTKDEEQEEEEESKPVIAEKTINLGEYEPDFLKVTTLVSSVKQLRHRMSISKKLEVCRPHKSLDQMIKEKIEFLGEHDEFTDGTCVLMKRRLEKQRRGSEPAVLGNQMAFQRRRSIFAPPESQTTTRRGSSASPMRPLQRSRSASLLQLPTVLPRSATSLGFGERSNLSDGKPETITEDELLHRQRLMKELANYEQIKERVEKFLQTK